MLSRRSVLIPLAAAGLCGAGATAWAGLSRATRAEMIEQATREGALEIWSTTDLQRVQELLSDFRGLYPGISVTYSDLHGSDLQASFLDSAEPGGATADMLWSSAMDLQIKLVNDGFATTYRSPQAANLPAWAKWKNQAWGITAEPIVFVYNKRLIPEHQAPNSHVALRRFLESGPPDPVGKAIATYDPDRSAVGYLYLSQDEQASGDVWRLVRAMARNRLELYTSAEDVLRDVSAGRAAIGYNIVGSYALDELDANPDLGVIMPQDYTLVMSRIAMIPHQSRHPAAARLFLDFLLSREGQQRLAERHIMPARTDVPLSPLLMAEAAPQRAIRVGPGLLVSGDQLTRRHFLSQWHEAVGTAPRAQPDAP